MLSLLSIVVFFVLIFFLVFFSLTLNLIPFLLTATLVLSIFAYVKHNYNLNRKAMRVNCELFLSREQEREIEDSVDVYLTAWNDEESIGQIILDFYDLPQVNRVILIDNNSKDSTRAVALAAGAEVIIEELQGYGHVVFRCLQEGSNGSTPWFVICEGDGTFSASDLNKLLEYRGHAPIVNGTRIVEQLRDLDTQLTFFIFFSNFAAAKILELFHFGRGTFTDLGTTYKLIHRETMRDKISIYNPNVNHEFNAHFMDRSLRSYIPIVEVPITFHRRIGYSKGANRSNLLSLKVGLSMLIGITTNWRLHKR